jgi:hypothetical protein
MPLIVALVALFIPRIVMVLLWLFTNWFQGVFATALWPLLGFIVLPTTTLWYSVVANWFGGQWGIIPVIGLVVSIVLDISPSGYRRRRVRSA